MGVQIHLLGAPRVVRDGSVAPPPRGNKVWGLLAYLLLKEVPPTRRHVADLLFPAAEDPLAALRWSLSQLRRLLGDPGFVGDPLAWVGRQTAVVDVLALRSKGPVDASGPTDLSQFADVTQGLMPSMSFPDCPAFEIWLEAERRHAQGAAESMLHEAALDRLAHGEAESAADVAGSLVGMNPFDENYQALLVRSLAVAGRGVEAARQAAACRELFRAELGVDPGPALDAALRAMTAAPTAAAASGRPAVLALLLAGEAAIGAGALEPGLHCLRQAVADAQSLADSALTARGFSALGTALVHAARGSDEEGSTALHHALACRHGEPETRAHVYCELAYVEFLHGRYDRVENWLNRADKVDAGPAQRAAALCVRGSTLSDLGRYAQALEVLGAALAQAQDDRRRSYVLSMIGRVHLLRIDLDQAVAALDESMARATSAGWTTFIPWPESFRAEVDLHEGDLAAAQQRLDHAFALGCQVGDPCWEGIAARGLGLVHAARGDIAAAETTLLDAQRRAARLPDSYLWVRGHVLDALAGLGVAHDLAGATTWIAALERLSEHSAMAELAARATIYRWRRGDVAALDAARMLAESVDNPLLNDLLPPRTASQQIVPDEVAALSRP